MTHYDVLITEPAEAEFDSIYQRLLLTAPSAAEAFRAGFTRAVLSLGQMPGRCPLAPENALLERKIRHLLFRHGRSTYRLVFAIYEADEELPAVVRILRIRHGAQRLLDALSTEDVDDD